ncbi:serine protease grass [Musca domestica]|uniref:CLIP domain-containing serine protease n=1 Tax=Musca domestica TaxID=7370 RepID=A0A1I8MJX3_MUSDO|nr:serine protease grass [Musca domestica]
MEFQEFLQTWLMALVVHSICITPIFGQTNGVAPNAYTSCFTPDYTQGYCVPMAKCRRIEWLVQNWSPPYPEHITRYIRQSHCGTRANVHYACCAFYDVNDSNLQQHHLHLHQHHHVPPPRPLQFPGQLARPSPSPSMVHNPHYPYHSGSQVLTNGEAAVAPNSPPARFHHRPAVNYLQAPPGERILRSMPCGHLNGDRIANGEIVRLSEYPWMVLLESRGWKKSRQRFRCAGTLITNQYVLTAGHCVEPSNEVFSIRLGDHNLKTEQDCENYKSSRKWNCAPPYEDVGIESVFLHPNYKLHPIQHDIALIRLQRPVTFNTHIKPICLPLDSAVQPHITSQQIVAGWGVTEKGYASDVLLRAPIALQNIAVCQNFYPHNAIAPEQFLCAGGGADKRGTCRADSGGPMFAAVPYEHQQLRYVQFGITSGGGYGCGGKHNSPGIYTNIRTYVTWIISNIF